MVETIAIAIVMVPTIQKQDFLPFKKPEIKNVRIRNESGFQMIGFWIPTVYVSKKNGKKSLINETLVRERHVT